MKKAFRNYLGIWGILLVLFHIIAFVTLPELGAELGSVTFWVPYGAILLAFAGQLVCTRLWMRKSGGISALFYHLPLVTVSYTGLILTFLLGAITMVVSALPHWVGITLCALVLGFTGVAVLKAEIAADAVETVEEKLRTQTAFIRLLTADAEHLVARAKTDEAKAACKKVYEAIRYSDPVSSEALIALEQQISAQMDVLTEAVTAGNDVAVTATAAELAVLMEERNQTCKALKSVSGGI